MFGQFYPVCVYGVLEPDRESVVDHACLDEYDTLAQFTSEVMKLHACELIYGVVVSFEDALQGTVSAEAKQEVQAFVDKFNGRFSEPKLFMAMGGDYQTTDRPDTYYCKQCGGCEDERGEEDEEEEDGGDA